MNFSEFFRIIFGGRNPVPVRDVLKLDRVVSDDVEVRKVHDALEGGMVEFVVGDDGRGYLVFSGELARLVGSVMPDRLR